MCKHICGPIIQCNDVRFQGKSEEGLMKFEVQMCVADNVTNVETDLHAIDVVISF